MTDLSAPGLLTGHVVDARYRVGEVIGRGAMSEVYRAIDERLHRAVALKALRADCTDPRRFAEETKVLCAIDHPHLVRLLDAGTHDGVPYLVLNLLDGTLGDRLRLGPIDVAAAVRIGAETAGALAHLHTNEIVHRDIKPSNILLREDGAACLADLGAALSIDGPRLTATGLTIGTPMYLAPEQAIGGEVTGATDIYSLGLVLLEATTGEFPFQGTPQERLAARMTRSPAVSPALPAPVRAVLAPMLAVDPSARPAVDTVARELARLAAGDALEEDLDEQATAEMAPATMALTTTLASPTAEWTSASRYGAAGGYRAVWWIVGLVFVIALVLGVASRDGIKEPAANDPAVATTVPTTTAPVSTAPPPASVVTTPVPSTACGKACDGPAHPTKTKGTPKPKKAG